MKRLNRMAAWGPLAMLAILTARSPQARAATNVISVATSGSPSTYGQSVTFTATVTGSGPTPTGTVTFDDGANPLGTGTLDGSGHTTFATNTLSATSHSITAVYGGDNNYGSSTSTSLTQVVNLKALTITANSTNKPYGQTLTFAGTEFIASGLVNGDTVTSVTLTSAGAAATATVASSPYSIIPSSATGTGLGNYSISYVNGLLTVNPRTLTVSAVGTNKVYDGTTGATVTLSDNRVPGDNLTTSYASASFADKTVGVGKTVTVSGIAVTGPAATNYTANTTATTTASITPAPVTGLVIVSDKIYDGLTDATITGYALAGVLSNDNVSLTGGTANFTDKNVSTGATVAVIAVNSGGPTNVGNFVADTDFAGGGVFATNTVIDTSAVTNPAPPAVYQTERVGNFTYTFSGLPTARTYTIRLHFAEIYWTNAGQRVFNVSINGSPVLTNFDIIAAAGAPNKATIKEFTATANTNGQIVIQYADVINNAKSSAIEIIGNRTAAVNSGGPTVGNFAADTDFAGGTTYATNSVIDTSAVTNPAPPAVYQTERFGNFTYTFSGFTTAQTYKVRLHFAELYWTSVGKRLFNVSINGAPVLTNYDIIADAGAPNKATIKEFPATANTNGQIVIQYTSVIDNAKSSAFEIIGGGTLVTVTGLTLTGADAGNYTLTSNSASTSASITAAPLTVTANQTKVYGAAVPALTASYTGFVNGEGTNVLSGAPDLSAEATATSPVAGSPYTITVTNGTLSAENYTFAFVDGVLTVTPATLTASVAASDKVYDGTTAATIVSNALSVVVGTDDVSLVIGSANFSDKNVASNKTVSATGLTLGGNDAGNYTLASGSASTTANITPATLTVTADNQTRAYGAANPTLTASYSGFVNGEVLATSGVTGSPSLTTAATPTSPVSGSPYTIAAASGSLAANNYAFSFLGGLLTVTPANASAAVVSSLNPACAGVAVNFTATVTPSGAGTPTGTVQFKIDGGNFGSPVPLSGNSATSGNISTLTAGSHTITAVYSGDGNFNGTTSPDYTQTVNALPAAPTAGNDGPACVGTTLHLNASTVAEATYSWTGPNGFASTNQNPAISNVTTNAAGVYSVTVTVNGCASAAAGTTGVAIDSAPSISGNPSGATKCAGDTITFSVTASGDGLTYQWRKGGTNIAAAISNSYSIAVIATNDAGSYDCVVSGTCSPSATSTAAILSVSPTAVAGMATATATNVCSGSATTITLSGYTGAIQWQSSTDNVVFANISGETNATVSTGPLVETTYFRAVVTSGPCALATSTVAAVIVNTTAPSISAGPASTNTCQNGAATFSVTASGNGPLSYMWRKRGTGWASGWTLNAGGGGLFVSDSTGNNGGDPASNGGNDINTGGRAWGLSNTGGDVTEALRPFPAALGVGQTFAIDMDNGKFVDGTVGFGLQNSGSGSNRLEIYFVGGNGDYTISDATGAYDSGVAFTDAGIHVLVRLTGADTYAVTITRYIDGSTQSFAGALSNSGAVDRLRLFDANGVGGSNRDLYFNNVRVGNADDNAADAAYNGGWSNSSNGGQMPLVNGGDIAGANTATLTISPAALSDGGLYDACVNDACGLATISSAAMLTVNSPPSCTISPPSATICAGGSQTFTVNPTGGTPGYTYLWSDGTTGTSLSTNAAGTYSVTVTDSNGCTTTCSATLTVNPTPNCTVSPASATICAGGSQTFTVNPTGGTVPYSYLWSDGTTGASLTTNAAGTYSVTVTDSNGCTTSCSATLTVNPLPTVFNVTGGGAYCAGGSGVAGGLSGSQSGVNYQLLLGGNPTGAPVAGTGSAISFGLQTGVGTYTVAASNTTTGCTSTMNGSVSVTLTDPFACWQLRYFGCTNCPQAAATADPDGDGQNNLAEFLAGTDPTNANSALRITAITPAGSDMRVYFTSVGGKYYSLERCDSMGGAWTSIVTNIPGNDGIQWVKDIGGAIRASGFYRILLSQSGSPPPVDSDGDGIPDWWTQQYFGHPTGQASDHSLATDDADGDGMSNLQEFLAGTDPTNSASSFRITSIVTTGNDLAVTWTMGSGKTNALQATNGGGYGTNGFVDIFAVTNTLGTVTNYLDVGGATNVPARYYRVRLVP